jgi:hypothetical protein
VSWRLTVRTDGQVDQQRFEGLDQLLDALERRGRELSGQKRAEPVNVKFTRFEPAQQVVARLEIAGPERWLPSVKAGVDVRGDGSAQAFRGGIRRISLDQQAGEDAFTALRRALSDVLRAAGGDAP